MVFIITVDTRRSRFLRRQMYNSSGFVQYCHNSKGCTQVEGAQPPAGRWAFAPTAGYIQFTSLQLISLKSILLLPFHLRFSFLSLNSFLRTWQFLRSLGRPPQFIEPEGFVHHSTNWVQSTFSHSLSLTCYYSITMYLLRFHNLYRPDITLLRCCAVSNDKQWQSQTATLEIRALQRFETKTAIYQQTLRNNPQDLHLQQHRYENFYRIYT